MNTKRIACALIFFFVASTGALAANLTVRSASGTVGQTVEVTISVDAAGVAGAAFTVTYDSSKLALTDIQSTFFDLFTNQWNNLNPLPNPLPPADVEVGGVTYNQPLVQNEGTNAVAISAARVTAGPAGPLLTLSFQIQNGASGSYPIGIVATTINNPDAGWNGESSPMLVGAIAPGEPGGDDLSLAFPTIPATVAPGQVTVSTSAPDDLGIDFGAFGVWVYTSATSSWANVSSANSSQLLYYNNKMVAVFPGLGLWQFNGTNWDQISSAEAEDMVGIGSFLFADFGALGVWQFDGAAWANISSANPLMLKAYGTRLVASFSGLGIWLYDPASTSWSNISSAAPQDMISVGADLYADFGGLGIYRFSGGVWQQISSADPSQLKAYGSDTLAAVFTGQGVWLYSATVNSWGQISSSDPDDMIAIGTDLYIDFGGFGIYRFNGSDWGQISSANPVQITAAGNNLVASFTGFGVYIFNGTSWTNISASAPDFMTAVKFQ